MNNNSIIVVVVASIHRQYAIQVKSGKEIGAGVGLRTSSQGYSGTLPTRQGYGLTENDQGSGQQHTWFRKLETQAGRWTGPDPYNGSMSLGNPQSFDRYSYVENEPTNYVDPSGLVYVWYGGALFNCEAGCVGTANGGWDCEWTCYCVGFCGGGGGGGGGGSSTAAQTSIPDNSQQKDYDACIRQKIKEFLRRLRFRVPKCTLVRA